MPNDYIHVPVLLAEVISYLSPHSGENFIDATLGGGGYSKEILKHNQPGGEVLAIDLDVDALENVKGQMLNVKGFVVAHGNFRDIDKIVENHKFTNIQGIVADLGLSSYELDQSGRGISFQRKELLDMRFDQSAGNDDAKFILNNYSVERLAEIFREFGEEKFSYQISKKIIDYRQRSKEIQYTTELVEIITDALPRPVKHKASDSARRIFQALRIAVNHELDNLEEFLPKAFDLLNPGGKLVVVSFHSLEDRIVKQFFVGLTKGCICPPEFPQCMCGKLPKAKILTKKLVSATTSELEKNHRSRPAKLRAVMKL